MDRVREDGRELSTVDRERHIKAGIHGCGVFVEQRIKKVERDGLTAVSEAAPGIDTHTLPIC